MCGLAQHIFSSNMIFLLSSVLRYLMNKQMSVLFSVVSVTFDLVLTYMFLSTYHVSVCGGCSVRPGSVNMEKRVKK